MHQTIKQIQNYMEMLKASGIDLVQVPSEAVIVRHSAKMAADPSSGGKDCGSVLWRTRHIPNDAEAIPEIGGPASFSRDCFASLAMTPTDSRKEALLTLRDEVVICTKCEELAITRKTVVFGSGNARAKLVFVGEAPGHEEDLQGLPFVGKAGQLLTKIIESIGLKREQVFICNVLKCRPPGNRNPSQNEISNCEPYLLKQIEIIGPKVVCALGTFAAQTLLKTEAPISSLRGRFYDYCGAQLICTFHPAYLLRNPEEKRKVWEDMKMIRTELTKTDVIPAKAGI